MYEITYYIDGWHGSWNSVTVSAAKLETTIAELKSEGHKIADVRPWGSKSASSIRRGGE